MKEELRGKAFKFGENISTDLICPGKYFHLRSNIKKLAQHTLEVADPEFIKNMKPGDFVVADENFGCGSSREHAPLIIKESGVAAVLAKSFARIFFRNAINIGLNPIECDTSGISSGDELRILPEEGIVENLTKGEKIKVAPLMETMKNILEAGGLKEYVKKEQE
ncbi:MAG: 3-isopropylmalate dehydratase small subunit [Elusimicrobia bacterium]|nr:3-isopropylmalate dehydratase small subunit [Elusimicrobiota bacterium]